MSNQKKQKTHFGFSQVPRAQKQKLVQNVFSKVAERYDVMNDLMSFGLHRLWKKRFITELLSDGDMTLLDVAGGTGDIAQQFIEHGGLHATVCDLNQEMLRAGQKRLQHYQHADQLDWVHGNAEDLPFDDNTYDYYSISFGIRNVTNIEKALEEAYRVLRPGGKFTCLEFSNVTQQSIAKIYDLYSFNVIPKIGQLIAGDSDAYQYLVESIRRFPKATIFATMLEDTGFKEVSFYKMTFGVVAVHIGYKPLQ